MKAEDYKIEKLKALRAKKKLTQKQVAEAVGHDRQTIYRAETGKGAGFQLLCKLAEFYDVPVTSLLKPRPTVRDNNFLPTV